MKTNNLKFYGNRKILDNYKTAFLCSRKCPSDIVLKSLDWAKEKKDRGECVISGFHSPIEKDVFNILIKGRQPVILILARGMKKKWPPQTRAAINENRLLVISPFEEEVEYVTQETANKRNRIMVSLADDIFLAHALKGGNLERLVESLDRPKIKTFYD